MPRVPVELGGECLEPDKQHSLSGGKKLSEQQRSG
jgi:hypothetical protein